MRMPRRSASASFQLIWDLNFRVFPVAMVWAASFFLALRTPSTVAVLVLLLVASGAAVVSAGQLTRQTRSVVPALVGDRRVQLAVVVPIAFMLLSQDGLRLVATAPVAVQWAAIASAISATVLWLFVMVVGIPNRARALAESREGDALPDMIAPMSRDLPHAVLALLVITLGWALPFVYLFTALPLAQALAVPARIEGGVAR